MSGRANGHREGTVDAPQAPQGDGVAAKAVSLTVTVPCPDRALCGNGALPASKGANIARNKLVAQQRADAARCAYQALAAYPEALRGPLFPTGRVRVEALVRRDPQWSTRRLDDDNFIRGCKGLWDALTDAGVWADDRQGRWGEIRWERAPFGGGCVLLTLTSEEG